MKASMLALIAISILIGVSAAQYAVNKDLMVNSASMAGSGLIFREEHDLSFLEDQAVSGAGFFSAYRYLKISNSDGSEGVESKDKVHGSGTINSESETYGNFNDTTWRDLYEDFEALGVPPDEFERSTNSTFHMKKDSQMKYNPIAMAVGGGYYAVHPVAFSSLLADQTCIKNRGGVVSPGAGTSMAHKVEDAHGLDLSLEAKADNIQSTVWVPMEVTAMKVQEDLTDGKAHFGVLQLPENGLTAKELQNPITNVNEDYIGSYHLMKNMIVTTTFPTSVLYDDWLPCCFGGYMTMPTYYKRGTYGFGSNVKGIFDCTCFKARAEAEWPRIYK